MKFKKFIIQNLQNSNFKKMLASQELTMNQVSAPQRKQEEPKQAISKFQDEVMVSENQIRQQMQRAMLDKFEEPKFCLINQENKRRVPLVHKSTIIGRNPNLLIQVNDISVSSKHASIDMNDDFSKAYLQDKGALNGCWINDQKMAANAKKRLQHNNLVRFGNSKVVFKFISVEQEKLEKEASESDGEMNIDQRQRFDMKSKDRNQDNKQSFARNISNSQGSGFGYQNSGFQNAAQQWPQPMSRIQQNLDVEHRLQQQENQIQMLLGNVVRGSQHEKEISIKQIVEDERKLLDDRYKKDLEKLRNQNEQERKRLEDNGLNTRNKNEKLQRVLVDKENDLLRHQEVVTDLESQLQRRTQQFDVSQAKLKALEQYTSELQKKHDDLIKTEQEKTTALNELLNNDLTQKVLEYKGMVTELREILKTKEKEREIYINHLNLGQADPQYGARLLEDQSKQILGYQTANEELEYRQGQCEKKWANLLDENQKNSESVIQLKAQLEQQRQTYTKLLNMTEKRVIQANMQISKLYSDLQDDAKKEAAEYLSAQVYQLYDERRQLASDNDVLSSQNSELQRLCSSQRMELDKYQAYIREDGCGPTASLIAKVEELQDLLIQQRQISDVSKIVQKDATIRSLNSEVARKTEQLEDMKSRIQQLMAAKGAPAAHQKANSNKEIAEYLQGMLKSKEAEIENQARHVQEVLCRENALKQKLEKMEYLYELDPNKPLIKYDQSQPASGRPLGQPPIDGVRSPHDNLAFLLKNQEASNGRRHQMDLNNQQLVRNQSGLYF